MLKYWATDVDVKVFWKEETPDVNIIFRSGETINFFCIDQLKEGWISQQKTGSILSVLHSTRLAFNPHSIIVLVVITCVH